MRSTLLTICVLAAAPAFAQSTTITASLTGDVIRSTRSETRPAPLVDLSTIDGEALGFNVAVARAIGDRWGVAIEFGRTGEIETRRQVEFDPRISARPSLVPPGIPIPDFSFVSTSELELTLVSALAWAKHDAGERVELSYAAGITFSQSESERDFEITDPRLAIWAVPAGLETTEYRYSPVVGMDAAIELTDRTAVTAGVRLHGIEVQGVSGWLVRPAVGVRWSF
jgi:hypothetical protein